MRIDRSNRGIQSAGAVAVFAMDRDKSPYMTMLASSWGLLAGSLIIALPLVMTKIKDHVSIEEDLKFSDETLADVAPKLETSENVLEVKA